MGINESQHWTPTLDINTNTKNRKSAAEDHTDGRTDGRMDRNIILTLRGFDPVAFGRMRYTQLRATKMIAKN